MKAITFEVHGVPKSKLRARSFVHPQSKRLIVTHDPKTRAAEESFAARAIRFAPESPLTCPIVLHVKFVMPIPDSWPKWKRAAATDEDEPLHHVSTPDCDNLLKLVKDACNGVFWLDDRQIWSVGATKEYGEFPRTIVSILGEEQPTKPEPEKSRSNTRAGQLSIVTAQHDPETAQDGGAD